MMLFAVEKTAMSMISRKHDIYSNLAHYLDYDKLSRIFSATACMKLVCVQKPIAAIEFS